MQYRLDKKTGNRLSALGCGSIRLPKKFGLTDIEKTEPMVLKAIEGGVNYFDTGYFYLGSEEVIGTIVDRNKLRDKVYLATKLPLSLTNSRRDFDKYFDKQLKRFHSDYIDYYLIHMMPDLDSWKTLCSWGIEEWIAEKKKRGTIRAMGFSFHGQQYEFLKMIDAYDWDFCQIQYNYSDENFQAGKTGLQAAAAKDMAVMVMEPLLGGRLVKGLPPKAEHILKKADPAKTFAEWGMNWVWNHEEVTVALSGMSSMSEVEENLKTANAARPGMLTQADLEVYHAVQTEFRAAFKIPCTSCNYCMPCPHNVNIPSCFAAYNQSYTYGLAQGMWSYVTSNVTAASKALAGASLCKKCGACEPKCSQNIPIMAEIEKARKRLEPWWFKIPLQVIGAIFLLVKKNKM